MKIKLPSFKRAIYLFIIIVLIFCLIPPKEYIIIIPEFISSLMTGVKYIFLFISIFLICTIKRQLNITYWLILAYLIIYYVINNLFRMSTDYLTPIIILDLVNLIHFLYFKDKNILYRAFALYFLLILIVSILFRINHPELFDQFNYFWFGNKNFVIRFFLPSATFCILDSINKSGKQISIFTCIYLAILALEIFICKSATGIVGIGIFIFLCVVFRKHNNKMIFSTFNVAIYTMIIFALIQFFNIQSMFEFFIVGILGKSLEFNGRTYIWNDALYYIKNNFLFGVGETGSLRSYLGFTHCHQYWLQNLMVSGLVGTIILLMCYFTSNNNYEKKIKLPGYNIILITIISFLIMGIDEALFYSYLLLPIIYLQSIYGNELITEQQEINLNK